VKFENVSFAYDGAEAVVRDIDLELKPGQCVAILGATGAGKSVLMSLIPRFFDPTAGRLLIDGIDARQLHLDDLRRNIGLVFQEASFSNTIAANIAFGHPDATREQIEKAARIAAAHDFIMAPPAGLRHASSAKAATPSAAASASASPSRARCCSSRPSPARRPDGGDRQRDRARDLRRRSTARSPVARRSS